MPNWNEILMGVGDFAGGLSQGIQENKRSRREEAQLRLEQQRVNAAIQQAQQEMMIAQAQADQNAQRFGWATEDREYGSQLRDLPNGGQAPLRYFEDELGAYTKGLEAEALPGEIAAQRLLHQPFHSDVLGMDVPVGSIAGDEYGLARDRLSALAKLQAAGGGRGWDPTDVPQNFAKFTEQRGNVLGSLVDLADNLASSIALSHPDAFQKYKLSTAGNLMGKDRPELRFAALMGALEGDPEMQGSLQMAWEREAANIVNPAMESLTGAFPIEALVAGGSPDDPYSQYQYVQNFAPLARIPGVSEYPGLQPYEGGSMTGPIAPSMWETYLGDVPEMSVMDQILRARELGMGGQEQAQPKVDPMERYKFLMEDLEVRDE